MFGGTALGQMPGILIWILGARWVRTRQTYPHYFCIMCLMKAEPRFPEGHEVQPVGQPRLLQPSERAELSNHPAASKN